jgi:ribose-phosphate pyrophosphokinase
MDIGITHEAEQEILINPSQMESGPRTSVLFALPATQEFGAAVARCAGIELGALEARHFGGGEHKIRPLISVRDRRVFVVQSLCAQPSSESEMPGSVNDRLCELLFFAATVRDHGASSTCAIVPYLAYSRKDRRTKARDPVTSRYVAQLIEAVGIERVVTVDVHNPAAFDNAFRIHAEHLTTTALFARHFAQRLGQQQAAIVSPDLGGGKRAQLLREVLERHLGRAVEFGVVEKRRSQGVLSGHQLMGDLEGRAVVLIDDLISTGTTLRRAARACREAGATAVFVGAAHALFASGSEEFLQDRLIDEIAVTDTVPIQPAARAAAGARLVVLSASTLVGKALRCLEGHGSLTQLLELQ